MSPMSAAVASKSSRACRVRTAMKQPWEKDVDMDRAERACTFGDKSSLR